MSQVISRESILDQLCDLYHYENWHGENIVSPERVRKCYEIALERDCIVYALDSKGTIMGYGEFKRINYEQMGRIICEAPFDVEFEDITSGNIAWISGVYIKPEYRNVGVIDILKTNFFRRTYKCDYFIGEARRKKHSPLKVFTRQQFYDKYITKEQV